MDTLPDDVLANVFDRLEVDDIVGLKSVSRDLKRRVSHSSIPDWISSADAQVDTLGIPLHLARNPFEHLSLHPPPPQWSPSHLLRNHTLISRSLSHRRWHALQLGQTWAQPVIPAMSLSSTRLVLGVGGRLLIHDLRPPVVSSHGGKIVYKARDYPVAAPRSASDADIIGVSQVHDNEVIVAQFNGILRRYALPVSDASSSLRPIGTYSPSSKSTIHTLANSTDLILTTSSSGLASLYRLRAPDLSPVTLQLPQNTRAWASHVSSDSRQAYFGLHSNLAIYPITSSGFSSTPSLRLHGPEPPSRSSPYDIVQPPSPSIHHPAVLLSAWYDSYLRLHDTRVGPAPVTSFFDDLAWSDGSAMYCTTFLGSHHIAGGCARHGTVALFDVRRPTEGFSIFSPGGKGSPVYALKGEGGRLWGVTERRAFVLTFDGSGEEPDCIVDPAARATRRKAVEYPKSYKPRGGKWGWSYRYGDNDAGADGDRVRGYEHNERGLRLFDSLEVR